LVTLNCFLSLSLVHSINLSVCELLIDVNITHSNTRKSYSIKEQLWYCLWVRERVKDIWGFTHLLRRFARKLSPSFDHNNSLRWRSTFLCIQFSLEEFLDGTRSHCQWHCENVVRLCSTRARSKMKRKKKFENCY
jgi:hypothetical protein